MWYVERPSGQRRLQAELIRFNQKNKGFLLITSRHRTWRISEKTYFNSQEVEAAFIGQGLGDHGLGASRGPVQQDPFRRLDPHTGEGLGVSERPLHRLLQLQLHLLHPAHV